MGNAYILDAVRTPRGKGKSSGRLHEIHPQELFATCLNALPERVAFDPKEVEDVVAGCVSEVGEQAGPMGRQAALAAGWPTEVTGVSLNRYCGSGQQAVNFVMASTLNWCHKFCEAYANASDDSKIEQKVGDCKVFDFESYRVRLH